MTNSIASAKCPSILASGKYGMSQRRSIIDDSKEYIFVKLTDSAFRAIEEYQRNAQSKRLQKGQCAKIQFIGNSGVIQFPPTADNSTSNGSSSDGRKFGFAIDDVEGSLECVQQSGTDLDVLGSLNYRMRIHANDDVYDTTRTKMAIAEETEKSKCIREIKPNQTDIGRKVKRPVSAASIQAYSNGTTASSLLNGNGLSSGGGNNISINGSSSYLSNSNNNHISSSSNSNSRNKLSATSLNQNSPPLNGAGGGGANGSGVGVNSARLMSNGSSLRSSPNPSLIGGNGTVAGGGNRYGSPSNLSSSNPSTLSANMLNGVGGISPPGSGNNILSSQQKKSNLGNGASNRGGNGAGVGKGSLGNNGKVNAKTLDVSRRKIRERLIHLLALKPFKKPELYSRLQNEGLAQRERQLISTILKDISTLSRDNTYNLRRSMWNDVDENWPFFSEQEIQQLKRRKPQNLTPPTSSDAGSSISGQSPTSSTHTGSPPPLVTASNMNGIGGGIKRTSLEPDFYDGGLTLGTQSKKQRISHYKKDGSSSVSTLVNSSNLGAGPRIGLGGAANNSNSTSYNQNHRSSSVTYSPHAFNAAANNGNDENSGNADLSFNVLNNMDDFIQNTAVVGGDLSYAGRSKTASSINKQNSNNTAGSNNCNSNNSSSNNNNVTSQTSSKEKRNSGGSSSSGYGSNRESSSSSAMRRKNSPTPYGNNFVPETKISSNPCNSNSSSSNSSRLNKPQQMQRHQTSPNYNSSSSNNNNNLNNHLTLKSTNNNSNSNNSVISNIHDDFSPSLAPPPPATQTTTNNLNKNLSSNRSRHHSGSSGAINGRNGGEMSSSKHSRSATPVKNFTKHHNNSSSGSGGAGGGSSNSSSSKTVLPQQLQNNIYNNNNNHKHHQQQQQQQDDQQALLSDDCTPPPNASHSSQQNQQQEHSSPTQQIAAAASTFSLTNHSTSSGDAPRYDFSSYTPITSIEQRRKYKTEFESDYDEYRKLLAQIESVGHRFRELADRLSRVQQGCIDYYNIKDQIVSEYNRIRKEEAINRDKQRFDYLHEKLAHIKQLVMDYDKKLTSGLAVPTLSTNQQQHQQQQQQTQSQQLHQHQQQVTATNNSAHLSPMLQSSGESNHSPPLVIVKPSTVNITNSLPSSSSSHTRKSSKHLPKSHQQKHQEHYKQHHEPVTIQMVDDDDDDNDNDNDDDNDNNDGNEEEITAIQYNQHPYNRYEAGDNYINGQQRVTSPAHSIHADKQQQHQYQQHLHQQQQQQQPHESPLQHLEHQNDNDSDTESDSSSSSSSNDDDNSDDDNSDASDDDNSDDDSNDDDNDDQ